MNDYIEKYKVWRRAWWAMQTASWALLHAQDDLENR